MADEIRDIDIVEILGEENVKHLHGNLYRVRREIVNLAREGIETQDGQVRFGNPRWVKNSKGKLVAKGLEKAKMDFLRESIQNEGLENPLRLRLIEVQNEDGETDYALEVVNGERRYRSIEHLCRDSVLCVDSATGERVPANTLYEWVDCRINPMDDKEAIQMALRPNETGESIGEVASINVVRVLRDAGHSDDQILELTGKSITWLRETDRLIALDPVTLASLQAEEINRRVALSLCDISATDQRLERLEAVKEAALARIARREQELRQAAQNARTEVEIETASAYIANIEGDVDGVEEHSAAAAAAEERASKKEAESQRLSAGPKTATSKDLDATRVIDDAPRPLSVSKLEKHWYNPVCEAIRSNGLDKAGNDMEIDLHDAKLVKAVLAVILEGKKEANGKPFDIFRILRSHRRD